MANSNSSEYINSYTTFSGCDIVCSFGSQVIGSLQQVSYSVSREKAPVYTFGNANARSFSRGKRGISGTLVFCNFDQDALLEGLQEHLKANKVFRRIGGEKNITSMSIDEWDTAMSEVLNNASSGVSTTADAVSRTQAVAETTDPVYADEIPPFDITVSMVNEYGKAAVVVIYGVELLNEASGWSIDNLLSQKACTFVARRVKSLESVDLSS